jgi:hypothetical protein
VNIRIAIQSLWVTKPGRSRSYFKFFFSWFPPSIWFFLALYLCRAPVWHVWHVLRADNLIDCGVRIHYTFPAAALHLSTDPSGRLLSVSPPSPPADPANRGAASSPRRLVTHPRCTHMAVQLGLRRGNTWPSWLRARQWLMTALATQHTILFFAVSLVNEPGRPPMSHTEQTDARIP